MDICSIASLSSILEHEESDCSNSSTIFFDMDFERVSIFSDKFSFSKNALFCSKNFHDKLLENSTINIILTGIIEEQQACEFLLRNINPDRVINFAGKTTFKELITLYSISDLLITNDSGPVHFASTTDIPILALFGPETPKIFGPMSPKAKVISIELACSPCISVFNQKKSSCNDNQCMKQISVQMVLSEAQKILGKLN